MRPQSITLRKQRLSDAGRFFEIVNNPNFEYFALPPKSIRAEKKFLREYRKNTFNHGYAIVLSGKTIVGVCGIKVDQRNPYSGEIGYAIDEKYWNKGIAARAVKLLEMIGFKVLKLRRIEIKMDPRNAGSERVALKCGYI